MAKKKRPRLGQRFAAEAQREATGFLAGGTANMLEQTDNNFATMLAAADTDGLSDREIDVIKNARKNLRDCCQRLRAIELRVKLHDSTGHKRKKNKHGGPVYD